jgi:hypothetical protein
MKQYFNFLVVAFSLSMLHISVYADSLPAPFKILPLPKNVQLLKQRGLAFGTLKAVTLKSGLRAPVMGYLLSQMPAGYTASGKGTLTINLNPNLASMPSDEGYIMTIHTDSVEKSQRPKQVYFMAASHWSNCWKMPGILKSRCLLV